MGEFEELGWLQVYRKIPVVTRVCITASLLVTIAVNCELISEYHIYLNPRLVLERFEIWRLLTAFLYAGPLNVSTVLDLLMIYRICRFLEETSFQRKAADFFFMLLLLCLFILILSARDMIFMGGTLIEAIFYLWCRRNPLQLVLVNGILPLFAIEIPLLMIFLLFLTRDSTQFDGLMAGHIYFFLEDVFPQQPLGFRILKTPRFLKLLFGELDEEPLLFPSHENGRNEEVPDLNQNQEDQAQVTPVRLIDENNNEVKSIPKDEPQPASISSSPGSGVMHERA